MAHNLQKNMKSINFDYFCIKPHLIFVQMSNYILWERHCYILRVCWGWIYNIFWTKQNDQLLLFMMKIIFFLVSLNVARSKQACICQLDQNRFLVPVAKNLWENTKFQSLMIIGEKLGFILMSLRCIGGSLNYRQNNKLQTNQTI